MRPLNRRRLLRWGLWVAAFAAAAASVSVALLRALDAADLPRPTVPLDVARRVEERIAALKALPRADGEYRVAFLGDSTATYYPGLHAVPVQLQQALQREGLAARVYSFGFPAMGPFEYYFLADLVRSAGPDQVVLGFNLAAPSERWHRVYARPELAGWIGAARLLEALRLPLHWVGVSLDDLLVYTAVVHAGAAEPWWWLRVQHARVERGWDSLQRRLGQEPPDRGQADAALPPGSDYYRFGGERIRALYGASFDGLRADHPMLRLLAAAVRSFVRAGVPVIVYVVPANVEHFERLGVLDEAGLRVTLGRVRRAVEGAGGVLLDLHALLPDAGFRDAGGHFRFEGPVDGPRLVAERLAPLIRDRASRSR